MRRESDFLEVGNGLVWGNSGQRGPAGEAGELEGLLIHPLVDGGDVNITDLTLGAGQRKASGKPVVLHVGLSKDLSVFRIGGFYNLAIDGEQVASEGVHSYEVVTGLDGSLPGFYPGVCRLSSPANCLGHLLVGVERLDFHDMPPSLRRSPGPGEARYAFP